MPDATDDDAPRLAVVRSMGQKLDKRTQKHDRLVQYVDGNAPFPPVVERARLTNLYRYLMPVSEAPFGSLVVNSKGDRLEVAGLDDAKNPELAKQVWEEGWQGNGMDAEAQLAHDAALLDGRCYATVWAQDRGGAVAPTVTLDDMTQMVVQFEEGSRRLRRNALRRWKDGDTTRVTLYDEDAIWKYETNDSTAEGVRAWKRRQEPGDAEWPVPNPLGVLPVVELGINRRLRAGVYPYARGEFAHCTGLIDRINLLTFLGVVVAFWMGFPMRGITGEPIRRELLVDDNGEPLLDDAGEPKSRPRPPVEAQPDSLFQLENPEAKLVEFAAADRRNLRVHDELDQLAVITATPRHYFPMEGGMSNLSAEAIMASEGAMHAATTKHKATLGEGWLDVDRLSALWLGGELSPVAQVRWRDHHARSLAERADAASKLKDVLPWAALAELVLDANADQIARWQAQGAMDPLAQLMSAAAETPGGPVAAEPAPGEEFAANGSGAG